MRPLRIGLIALLLFGSGSLASWTLARAIARPSASAAASQPARGGPDARPLEVTNARLEAIERSLAELARAVPHAAPELVAPASDAGASEVLEALQKLREQVDSRLASLASGACGPDGEAVSEQVAETPRSRESFGEARRLVDYALSSGRWTEDDASRLREQLPHLTPKQLEDIHQNLFVALNSGQIEVDLEGPPF
jgi:hypothetical protein